MKKSVWTALIAIAVLAADANCQILAGNGLGVSLGQWHTIVRDVGLAKKFWTTLGGTPLTIDGTDVMRFAGVLIFLKQGEPVGGSEGTVVDHIGFGTPDVAKVISKVKDAGFKVDGLHGSAVNGLPVGLAWSSDNLLVEIGTVQTLSTPCKSVACIPGLPLNEWPPAEIASNHIHFYVASNLREEMQKWYVKMFGAVPGVLGPNLIGELPGTRFIRWGEKVPVGHTTLPTKGHALDYIGFEVRNLAAFCKRLDAAGVKLEEPYSKSRYKSFASAFLIDPWGVGIELTEGLNKF